MFKILVVDDEPRHRRCLSGIIQSIRRDYEVIEAKNGIEALELVNAAPVNVIITDIKMPLMDGLTFIEKLGDKIRSIKVIFLSGFPLFDYAQKALSLGAFDFIVKPFNEDKIKQALMKAEEIITREILECKEQEKLRHQLKVVLPSYLDHRLNQWICGSANGLEEDELADIFPYQGAGVVFLLEISDFDVCRSNYRPAEFNEIKSNIKLWTAETLSSAGHVSSFYLENCENILITIIDSRLKKELFPETVIPKLNTLLANLQNSYGFNIVIGVGSIEENIFDAVVSSYQQAWQALRLKFFEGANCVLSFQNRQNQGQYHLFKSEHIKTLKKVVLDWDAGEIKKAVDEFLGELRSEYYFFPEQFRDIVFHNLADLVRAMPNILPEDFWNRFILEAKELISGCASYEALRANLPEFLGDIASAVDTGRKNHFRTADIYIKYIEEHYMEDLSLEQVSQKFGLNPNYFSGFFKSNTGVNYSEYLQKVRLSKAQELLQNGNSRIYEIAGQVGYHDVKYFIRVFKKEFGVSPDEYRKTARLV